MSTKIGSELDRSFGAGPAHRPVEERIAAGRKALVRRRVARGAAGLVVVAVLTSSAAWALGLGDDPAPRGTIIANDPAPSTSQDATPTPSEDAAVDEVWENNIPLRYIDGELQIRPGVVVHEHIENPYDYEPPKMSDALDITFEGQRLWTIVQLKKSGYGFSSTAPSNGWASFADYVADQVVAAPRRSGWPDTLRLTQEGSVVASEGSEILQRSDDPQLGESFASSATPTGAALVRAAEDDVAYFVVWRVLDGELDVITVPPADVNGATFQELLSYARSQYASGEGLR